VYTDQTQNYRIKEAEITIVFVEAKHIDSIVQLAPKCPKIRVLVSIDRVEKETLDKATESLTSLARPISVTLHIWDLLPFCLLLVEAAGKAHPLPPTPPKPDDVATICYTSGTSGPPKGAVLTHWNLTSSAIAFSQGFVFRNSNGSIRNGAIISYLPLAHIVGRIIELTAFLIAFRIGYYSGDPLKLIEDCQILKPTIFPSVPRVLNRIAVKIQSVREEASIKG
jgi:long-chain acyl-CoA synthetase